MPRNYIRTSTNPTYTQERLHQAVEAVKNGLSGYKAAKSFSIPRSTIMAHVTGIRGAKSQTQGRSPVLPADVEKQLAEHAHTLEKHGFGLSKQEVIDIVGEYINKNNIGTPFKNGIPGHDWYIGFSKRHNLSIKKPQGVEFARKKMADPFIFHEFYNTLDKAIKDLGEGDVSKFIWNLDETSFCQDPSKTKVVGLKGFPSTRTISTSGRDNTSVLLGCSAAGDKLPPLVIFKGKYVWSEWVHKDPNSKTNYAATKRGWMETEVFENYFIKTFVPDTRLNIPHNQPILLLYDGHSTHITVKIIEHARANNTTIIKLPPHSSHLLQPLDLSVMKPMKDNWDRSLVKWQRLHYGSKLPKKEFSRLITEIWHNLDRITIRNGFSKGGIYPLKYDAVPQEKFDQMAWARWKILIENNASKSSLIAQDNNEESMYTITQSHVVDRPDQYILKIPQKTHSENTIIVATSPPKLLQDNPKNIIIMDCKIIKLPDEHINRTINFDVCLADNLDSKKPTGDITANDSSYALNNCVSTENNENTVSLAPHSSKTNFEELSSAPHSSKTTFEELLLRRISRNEITKAKRSRVATGSEVITSDLVYKRIKMEHEEKEKKMLDTNNRKVLKNINNIQKKLKTKQKLGTKKSKYYDNTSSEENEVWESDSSDTDASVFFQRIRDEHEFEMEEEIKDININMSEDEEQNIILTECISGENEENLDQKWVLVKFSAFKSLKHYVGQVVSINENKTVRVKFVRKTKKKEGYTLFSYPTQDDFFNVYPADIVSILPEPSRGRRGVLMFNIDFAKYNLK